MANAQAVRETLSVIGVILGLVFVGYETRQNTNALKSQTAQAVAEMSRQQMALGFESPAFQAAWALGITRARPDSLTLEQRQLLGWWTAGMLRNADNRFRQIQLGTLEGFDMLGGEGALWRSEWFKGYWEVRRDRYSPEFVTWLEKEVLDDP